MSEQPFFLVTNADGRTCKTCGAVHSYMTQYSEFTGSCATPIVWTEVWADKLGSAWGEKVPLPLSPVRNEVA